MSKSKQPTKSAIKSTNLNETRTSFMISNNDNQVGFIEGGARNADNKDVIDL